VQTAGELRCWRSVKTDGNWDQKLPPAGSYVAVAAGVHHTCTLLEGEETRCWGYDAYGETVPPQVELAQISAGDMRSCGITTDGALHCWGKTFGAPQPEGQFVAVAQAVDHACAIDTSGGVHCWGMAIPEALAAPGGAFQKVAVGEDLSCGLRVDGSLACWGDNARGRAQPPRGTYIDLDVDAFGCAVSTAGDLSCWGMEHEVVMLPTAPQVAVAVNDYIVCATPAEGATDCFGPGAEPGLEDLNELSGFKPHADRKLGQRNTLITSDKPRKHTHRWRHHRDVYAQFNMIWPGRPKDEGWSRPVLLDAMVDKQSFFTERTAPGRRGEVLAKLAWYDLSALNVIDPIDPDADPDAEPEAKAVEPERKREGKDGEDEEEGPRPEDLPPRTYDEVLDAIVVNHGIDATPGTYLGHPTREAEWEVDGRLATWRAILAHDRVFVVVVLAPGNEHFAQLRTRFFEAFRPLDPAEYDEAEQAERAAVVQAWAEGEAASIVAVAKQKEDERRAVIRVQERREAQIEKGRAIAAGERLPDNELAMLYMLVEHLPGLSCTLWTDSQWGVVTIDVTFDIEDGRVHNARFTNLEGGMWGKKVKRDPTGGCLIHAIGEWKFPDDINTSITYSFEFI
jgi:hypothetical protein